MNLLAHSGEITKLFRKEEVQVYNKMPFVSVLMQLLRSLKHLSDTDLIPTFLMHLKVLLESMGKHKG